MSTAFPVQDYSTGLKEEISKKKKKNQRLLIEGCLFHALCFCSIGIGLHPEDGIKLQNLISYISKQPKDAGCT